MVWWFGGGKVMFSKSRRKEMDMESLGVDVVVICEDLREP